MAAYGLSPLHCYTTLWDVTWDTEGNLLPTYAPTSNEEQATE